MPLKCTKSMPVSWARSTNHSCSALFAALAARLGAGALRSAVQPASNARRTRSDACDRVRRDGDGEFTAEDAEDAKGFRLIPPRPRRPRRLETKRLTILIQ